jgi:hypothetical protein
MSKLFRRNLETQTYRGEFECNMLVEESREGRRIVDHFAPTIGRKLRISKEKAMRVDSNTSISRVSNTLQSTIVIHFGLFVSKAKNVDAAHRKGHIQASASEDLE